MLADCNTGTKPSSFHSLSLVRFAIAPRPHCRSLIRSDTFLLSISSQRLLHLLRRFTFKTAHFEPSLAPGAVQYSRRQRTNHRRDNCTARTACRNAFRLHAGHISSSMSLHPRPLRFRLACSFRRKSARRNKSFQRPSNVLTAHFIPH